MRIFQALIGIIAISSTCYASSDRLFTQDKVIALKAAESMMVRVQMNGKNKVCSKLYGQLSADTNVLSTVCGVCLSGEFDDKEFVASTSLSSPFRENDVISIGTINEGDSGINDAYTNDLNFIAYGKIERSNIPVEISCSHLSSGPQENLSLNQLNETFAKTLKFRHPFE